MIDKNHDSVIIRHWIWAVPILMAFAALSIWQLDRYPPTSDELHSSMYSAGWLNDLQYSPIDVVLSLYKDTPEHVPVYFVLLNIWGKLVTNDIAVGKVLGVYFALLGMSTVFRLARDSVAPAAGIFALVIFASNAFFNYYIAHARMYSLLVLNSALVLWLYLRIAHQARTPRLRDYCALSVAVVALIGTHLFSALLLLTLGIYHLIFVPKNARWWIVSIAAAFAILIVSPYLLGAVSRGISRTVSAYGDIRADGQQAIAIWLSIVSNNQVGLIMLSVAGLALGAFKQKIVARQFLLLPVIFLATLGLFAELTLTVYKLGMRYQLAGWLPFVLLQVAGIYALFRFRRILGLVVVLWVIAGLMFQSAVDWNAYLSRGRLTPFELPAYHAVSRLAARLESRPYIIGLPYHPRLLDYGKGTFTTEDYYFGWRGIHLELIHDSSAETLVNHLRWNARFEPEIWLFYQKSKVDALHVAELAAVVETLHYRLCNTVDLGFDTVLHQYAWVTFGCETARTAANHRTQLLKYEFYGATLDEASSRLFFSDSWSGEQTFQPEDYRMSYQLIAPDWDKVAQLDLPLVDPEESRIFYIDVSEVPEGSYRLMAILYKVQSGDRISWLENDGNTPDMLTLADVRLQ